MFKNLLMKCLNGQTLTEHEAELVMDEMMQGNVPSAQIASFLTVLTYRGETVDEITGLVRGMRKHMNVIDLPHSDIVDTCGTGGDGASTFNISTASAIAASSVGVKIAKHGNRAVSSKSGSADVLEHLGINIQANDKEATKAISEVGMSFLFAPMYHPAMKHAAVPRKELGFRTVFNALGPLANPTNCKKQVIGVYSIDLAEKLAEALKRLSSHHVLFVAGRDGLDEISIATETDIVELKDGEIYKYTIKPEDFGLNRGELNELVVSDAKESAALIESIFQNEGNESARNAVILNAAAAIYVAQKTDTLLQGVELAKQIMQEKTAYQQLQRLKSREVVQHA
ncbi:anthranilate phosphoribosyltransferase [Metabacillus iocasae]|uniref:Anthranilate phosphoribosyltransferase n=1 Tax=Priestia iocasae TaxID=2291674 RepID=A0ABS2QRZ0_9BACI|nr:anthranilate phosphoribosyltransferase [Metabacillus iocasae]MBM7701727.1 anthranilate phosphoribosyltransferase [Metabacillus iocasae]